MKDLTVLQAKRIGVYRCRQGTPLIEAARQMAEEEISTLVVEDQDGFLVGIITRIDFIRASQGDETWRTQPVEDHMSREVITITPYERLSHVAQLLLDKGVHRVVVVQEEEGKKRPLGVISAADLIYHMVKNP